MKTILEWIKAIVGALIILFVLNLFIGATSVVNVSMEPTLQEGDLLLMLKVGGIGRGDVVTFNSSLKITESDLTRIDPIKKLFVKAGDPKILVKRVIGLPGDKISIKDGQVFINDELLDESNYYMGETIGDITIEKIPEGEYFLMGDNRPRSEDSRYSEVGLVKRSDIIGKAVLRYWPLNKIRIFGKEYK
ncbi:signal peptidase I [Guggenheimella bovis]